MDYHDIFYSNKHPRPPLTVRLVPADLDDSHTSNELVQSKNVQRVL